MNKTISEKHSDITFDDEICALYADVIQQDVLNVKVLFHIAQCEQSHKQVTVKSITDNVKGARRVGVKDSDNTVIGFSNQDDYIDRKTAEKIVDRLAYASLIYFAVQRPFKFIRLTSRGIQVAMEIKKQIGGNES